MNYRIILSVKGQDPVFLGDCTPKEVNQITQTLQSYGELRDFVHIYEDVSARKRQGYAANPAPNQFLKEMDKKSLEKLLIQCLQKPLNAFKTAPLNREKCSIGRTFRKKGEPIFPISYKEVEKISMEEVAAHLGPLIPRCRAKMPLQILGLFEQGKTVIPKRVIDENDLSAVTTILLENLFRANLKMAKSKVPESLGIGKPMGDGLSEAPVSGSLGLQFMPNTTLLTTNSASEEKGFRTIIQEYAQEPIKPLKRGHSKSQRSIYHTQIAVKLADDTLKNIKGNACIGASKGCIKACNCWSGGRFNTITNIFGDITNDTDQMAGRMLLGFWQTAFIANPFYFLRLLIEAIYMNGIKHETAILEYNTKEKYLGDPKSMVNVNTYLKKLPLSIRLNTYSDYPWEMIYPDLFSLFNGKRKKGFGTYQPLKVQFYDYTKLSGRWTAKQRKGIWETLDLEIPKRTRNSLNYQDQFAIGGSSYYDLPENYHLTFSFNGKDVSKTESFIANLAGQNATFVFASQQLNNATLREILDTSNLQLDSLGSTEIKSKLKLFTDVFKKEVKKTRTVKQQTTVPQSDLLPLSYMGFDVISGDTYDLRFLDKYAQQQLQGRTSDLDPVIIGLSWKTPKNQNLSINGETFAMNPVNAAFLLDNVDNARMAEGFAQTRLGLGFKYEEESRGFVSLYFLSEDVDLESTSKIVRQIVSLSEDEIVSFATETGRLINNGQSPEEISESLTYQLSELVDSDI
jgi:hypothetical protein